MKKITIILLALCIALPLFAGDVDEATFTVSGNASVTFGMDLDTSATGFGNGSAADFVLNFKVPATALKSGSEDGAFYGEIAFKDIRAEIEENDIVDANIALNYAKIMGPNFWLSVKGPDAAIDYENAVQNGIIGIAAAFDGQMDNVSNTIASTGGFEVGVTLPDILAVELSLFSLTDWTSALDTAADNAYGLKTSVALKAVPDLTFEVAANLGFGSDLTTPVAAVAAVWDWEDTDDDPTTAPVWTEQSAAVAATTAALNSDVGIGAKLAYAIKLGDISITPEIAADIRMVDAGTDIAIGNGLKIGLGGSEVKGAEDAIAKRGTSVAWDDGVNDGLTVGWSYDMPAVGDAALGLQAHFGLGVVDNLQAAVGFEAANIMDTAASMGLAAYAKYTIGDVAPWAGLYMKLDNETNGGADGSMVASAGLTWSNLLPKTSLTVEWDSGELSADDTGEEADLGLLKLTVKVAY